MLSSPTRPVRILHLEDNPRDAEIIGHKLKIDGVTCEISLAGSKKSFDEALAREPFDLILCDYNLPDYDAVTALKRAAEIRPDTPVIVISGTVGEDEAVKCLQTGATDYLLKERLERLGPAVTRALREAEERRKRTLAEEALLQRERRLSSIYDTVADVLFYIEVHAGAGFRFVSVNPAFLSTTGLQDEQVVGQRVEEVIPQSSLDLVLERYHEAIRERTTVRWEQTFDYPKGRLTGEVSVAPVFDAHGNCTHLVGSVHDVTERRKLEAQLRQAQKMESVGQLAGGIAHDFNNLLTVINGMSEFALEQLNEDQHQIRQDLGEIRRAGERAAALTRQLLAFSRKQILQPQVVNLDKVVAEMGSMLRRLLGEDVDLITKPSREPATVKTDPGQIEQVLANLAVNGRDAMPRGGQLIVETRHCQIDDEFVRGHGIDARPGCYVVLAVSDTGTGMDDATRRQIFEPFFTTKAPGKGTGLGLSTVYGIVKQSGGFVVVDSEMGRGSCFAVYLPQVAEAVRNTHRDETITASHRGETILVVEDVTGLRRLITRTLNSAGYKVLDAASGEEAMSVLEQYHHPVHLTVTDVVMPGLSGREFTDRVFRLRPDMKVLYMSGYTDDVIVRHGVAEERVPFVNKPFGTADLLRAIQQVLDAPPPSRRD